MFNPEKPNFHKSKSKLGWPLRLLPPHMYQQKPTLHSYTYEHELRETLVTCGISLISYLKGYVLCCEIL